MTPLIFVAKFGSFSILFKKNVFRIQKKSFKLSKTLKIKQLKTLFLLELLLKCIY